MPTSSDVALAAPVDKGLTRVSAVADPSDGLNRASEMQTVQRDLLDARSARAMSAMAPSSGAPRALGKWLNPMDRLATASAIGTKPRAAEVNG